jgi:hypothetical protein
MRRKLIFTLYVHPIEYLREAIKGKNPFAYNRVDGLSEFFSYNFLRSDNYI